MFIDMHVHTGGISECCQIDLYNALDISKENGYSAVAITNHYTKAYFTDKSYDEWIEKYIDEYKKCLKYGEQIGLKVFFGIEVTFEINPKVHFLIYGADENFLRNNKLLCNKTQEQLYNICRENECALIQAHPFRSGSSVMNKEYLDGLEINCHPLYLNSYSEEIMKIAKQNNLSITVGCDFHADSYRAKGGMFLPDNLKSDNELAKYILKKEKTRLQIHEPANKKIKQHDIY